MANPVPDCICNSCETWTCQGCKIGDALADKSISTDMAIHLVKNGKTRRAEIETDRLNISAKLAEQKKPRRVRRTKAEIAEQFDRVADVVIRAESVSYIEEGRRNLGIPAFFKGRRNAFSQSCACCERIVEPNEGFLAKSDPGSAVWLVVCRTCKDDNIPIGAFHNLPKYTPGDMTIAEAAKALNSGALTMDAFMKAGNDFFSRQKEQTEFDRDYQTMAELKEHAKRIALMNVMNAHHLPAVYFPNKEGGLSEVVETDYSRLYAEIFNGTTHKMEIEGKAPLWFKADKARWTQVEVKTTGVTHDWTGYFNGTSSPSLCAGWGEQPPSRERKHRAKRPKRCGW
jgi:hypothetical protein